MRYLLFRFVELLYGKANGKPTLHHICKDIERKYIHGPKLNSYNIYQVTEAELQGQLLTRSYLFSAKKNKT